MSDRQLSLSLSSAAATARRAVELAGHLAAGDVILLSGKVGAGKTHFARALIQSLLPRIEDVPSPTFTLVQTYDTDRAEIWHADLYRLTSTLEIEELGLADAFESAICLVEWPDRLGDLTPDDALSVLIEDDGEEDARRLIATWSEPKWQSKLAGWRA